MERPKVVSLNENLTCGLCSGYLIEATTITTCLHSFCHSCIVKKLSQQHGEKLHCPACSDLNLPDLAPINIQDLRIDHLLQTIVYKLVPLLYEKEQKRRLDYRSNQNTGKGDIDKKNKNKNDVNFHRANFQIFCSFDVINVQISEMEFDVGDNYIGDDNNNNNNKGEIVGVDDKLKCRYLLCPIMLRVSHLKKFLLQKVYSSTPSCNVILCSHGKPLEDELCLADVCYIFGLQKTACITIKYIAYILPKIVKTDQIALDATELPLGPSTEVPTACSPDQEHGDQDANDLSSIDDSTSTSSHSLLDQFDDAENDRKNLISNDKVDTREHQFLTENVSIQEFSSMQVSADLTPEIAAANTTSICEQNLDHKTGAIITSPDEHASSVSCNDLEVSNNESREQQLSVEKVTILVDEKVTPSDKVMDIPVLPSSSQSFTSISTMMELSPSAAVSTGKLATSTINKVDSDIQDVDRTSESSSDTDMASPIAASSSSVPLDRTKPCRVILYRLPTAYFLASNKKRKHSITMDNDDNNDDGNSKINHNAKKNLYPPAKKKKLLNNQLKSKIKNLVVKYKAHLKKLLELKKTIQQLRKQNKTKTSHRKIIATENVQIEVSHVEPVVSVTDLSVASTIASTSSIISTCQPAGDLNPSEDVKDEDCQAILPVKTTCSSPININDTLPSISMSDKHDVSPNFQPAKQNIILQNEKLESGLSDKCINILPLSSSEASKHNSKPAVKNLNLESPITSRCLSNSTDISWLLKYARLQTANNIDKIGARVVESGGLVSRYQDVQAPIILHKRSLLDFVRLPQISQRCSNRINSFHNTSAAIRSTYRTTIPASNYLRPAYNPVINQTSELENLRQYLSALANQQAEISLNNLNNKSLDFMTYLERNHHLINGMSLSNQSVATCFPLNLNGCNPTIRHNFIKTQKQSVSTQTGHLDLINQYFCKRSKPVPSIFAGRMRPTNSKRSFNHAFGPEAILKKNLPSSSKKIRYANEDYLNKIASINPLLKDNIQTHSSNLETVNSHKLFPLSSVMTPTYRHVFTELMPKCYGPTLRPLSSVNPNRAICLTPPTDILKRQLICNGPCEISSSQTPSSRPRSSSANAAEVYETLAGISGGTVDSMKNLATPLVDMAQSLSSLPYDCQLDDKNILPNCSLLKNQLSPRQKDSFYSIPRKSLFPIFSKSSKLNIYNLQNHNIFPSNTNGASMLKEPCTLSISHQARKVNKPTTHFPLSKWNPINVNMNDSLIKTTNNDNNVTLDLSKKRKKMDSNLIGEALRADFSKNYKAVKSLASMGVVKSSGSNKISDCQSIISHNAFPSYLTVTSLNNSKHASQSAPSKVKAIHRGNEEPPCDECPNVIDFRRSLPVTSFKLCDLKNLPFSTLVSVSSNVDGCTFVNNSNIVNDPGKDIDSNNGCNNMTGNYIENNFTQIDAVLLEINGNNAKSKEAQSHISDANVNVTCTHCSTSEIPTSSQHINNSTNSSDAAESIVDFTSEKCYEIQNKVEKPSDEVASANDKIEDNVPTAQENNKEITPSSFPADSLENIVIQSCNSPPENNGLDNKTPSQILSDSAANETKQKPLDDQVINKNLEGNDLPPLEVAIDVTGTTDMLQTETTESSENGSIEECSDKLVTEESTENVSIFSINYDNANDVGVSSVGDVNNVKFPNDSQTVKYESRLMSNIVVDDKSRSDKGVSSEIDQLHCDRNNQADNNKDEDNDSSLRLNPFEENVEQGNVDDAPPIDSNVDSEILSFASKGCLDSNAPISISSDTIN